MSQIQDNWIYKITEKEYFNSLSHPRFLELDGLIILESHHTPESFERWKITLIKNNSPAEFGKIENTINHVHLDDFATDESQQKEIGEYLRKIWVDTLSAQFPNEKFICEVKQYEAGWELVLWKMR